MIAGTRGELRKKFRDYLLRWGQVNLRTYPWRETNDPYRILVSEFMLHRTQTKQVVPIYNRFIESYPSLRDFAQGSRRTVDDILRPLGLQWRIVGMVKALDYLWKEYRDIPVDYEKLMGVPGIGQYIAGATICFSQNVPLTLIDSNIVRVVGRVYGLDLSGEARRKRPIIEAIGKVCDRERPKLFYYTVIDLAHEICRPRKPECWKCPLVDVPCEVGKKVLQNINQ